MNTIPTTTKRLRIPYTVVGGTRSGAGNRLPRSVTILLLNRGGRPFKRSLFTELIDLGASEVISIESPGARYDVENFARKFPGIRFILLNEQISTGERVNIGIHEAKGDYVFVLWNDMKLVSGLSARIIETIANEDVLCTVPVMQNQRAETVPTIQAPAFYRRHLKIVPATPNEDGMPTIFPFDYCGIYEKEKFTLTGGFDYLLHNSYWQKLDFGFRSFMWGERIIVNTGLRVRYLEDTPAETTSRDESYKLFFLKNLAVRFNRDVGRLPVGQFLPYLLKSGGDFITALREFRQVMKWVNVNKYRFKEDARSITDLWEIAE